MAFSKTAHSTKRWIIQSRRFSSGPTKFEEWKAPAPWGHISGKWWGDKKSVPILAIHEFRQNAAAFDNLIPKLNVPSVLALDLPGHGTSSHFAKGRYITIMEYLAALRYVTFRLPPGQLSLIGHGLGSVLAFVFAACYPKQVESLISIECGRHVFPEVTSARPNGFGEVVDRIVEIENSPPASYTEKELFNIMKNTSRMSDRAAEILLSRASQPNGDKLVFTHDPRNEFFFFSSFLDADLLTFGENLVCKMVDIRNASDDELIKYSPGEATGSPAFDSNMQQLARRRGPEAIQKLREESSRRLRATCRHFFEHRVRTSRHVLLDEANEIAQILNGFYSADLEVHQIITPQ